VTALSPATSAPALAAALATAIKRSHLGEPGAWDDFAALRDEALSEGLATPARLAAAGLLVSGHHLWRFEHYPACIAELAPLRDGPAGLQGDEELLACNGLLLGLLLCQPRDPFVHPCAARLQRLVESGLDINLTLAAARTLIYHFDSCDLREPAMRLNALISARFNEPAATPYRQAEWLNLWRRCAHYGKQPQAAEQALAQVRALAQRHGLRRIEFIAALADLDLAVPRGDVAAALAAIEHAQALADASQLREALQLELARARLARLRGQADSALHHATRTRKLAQELQLPPVMLANYVVGEAQALLLGERFEAARQALREQIEALPEGYAEEVAAMVAGIDAFLAVREGRPEGAAQLAALWRGLRERRSYDLFEGFPEFGARLCVMALEHGIETDFVCSLIAKCQLVAPETAPPSWPWPLRIQALGGFAVWRDDLLLASEGKAQRKPLALLQAVVALGALREERGVEVTRLVELLWSDEAVADPKASFEAALSRLRRWLGVEGALKISDGRLSLNARVVWCDVAAFERLCERLQAAVAPHADASALPQLLQQLGTLYRGKLFGNTALAPWSVLARERLSLRLARAVADAGAHLETHQRWPEALQLYETGLLQDMLAEPIHRALMRCHLALGQLAEARRAYERCRAVLDAELGLTPGAETQALLLRIETAR
jgi:DNA-binding SARP family transcriptional activator